MLFFETGVSILSHGYTLVNKRHKKPQNHCGVSLGDNITLKCDDCERYYFNITAYNNVGST